MTEQVIDDQAVVRLVQMRRGGAARDEALRWFRAVKREDGRPCLEWVVRHFAANEEEHAVGLEAVVRALDTFVCRPNVRQVMRAIVGHTKTAVCNAILDHRRAAVRRAQLGPVVSLHSLVHGEDSAIAVEMDADDHITLQWLIGQLDEQDALMVKAYLEDPDQFGDLEVAAMVDALRSVL